MKLIVERMFDDVRLPTKTYPTDSGFDIYVYKFTKLYTSEGGCSIEINYNDDSELNKVILKPNDRLIISTGIKARVKDDKVPDNCIWEIQVRARSGHGLKKGFSISQGLGTVDYSYSGEISVFITNISPVEQSITLGERIAQIVPVLVGLPTIEEGIVTEMDRGANGFNSTGTH